MHTQLLIVTVVQQQQKNPKKTCSNCVRQQLASTRALKDVGKEVSFVCVVVFISWWHAANKLQTKDHPQQTETNKQSFVHDGNTLMLFKNNYSPVCENWKGHIYSNKVLVILQDDTGRCFLMQCRC